ncbi:MAG: transposase [Planctomycetota bacterium]
MRTISNFYLRAARRCGLPRASTGAVVFDRRFDSAIRLDLHYHCLFADGAFSCALGQDRAEFHAQPELNDGDVARVVRHVRTRVLRLLRRLGKLANAPAEDLDTAEPDLLLQIHAAAVQGKVALGPAAGTSDARPGRSSLQGQFRRGLGSLCADLDGFSLHAASRVPVGRRDSLEHLIRYVARPPIVKERLSILPDGRVAYALKKRWRNGTTHVVLDPLTFLERLAALVPRPRKKLVNYYGVFASAASYRHRVVPVPMSEPVPVPVPVPTSQGDKVTTPDRSDRLPGSEQTVSCRHVRAIADVLAVLEPPTAREPRPDSPPLAETPGPDRRLRPDHSHRVPHAPRRRYYFWAELLKRVFLLDVLTCPHCGSARQLLAFLSDQAVLQKILRHLGLPTEPPELAPARPPPERTVGYRRL